jgi:hypothetical protein
MHGELLGTEIRSGLDEGEHGHHHELNCPRREALTPAVAAHDKIDVE